MNRLLHLLTSKTVWGAVVGAGGYLSAQPHIGIGQVAIAAGGVLAAVGVKDNFVKVVQAAGSTIAGYQGRR